MNENNIKCEFLYEEYKKLKETTHLEAQILRPGQPYKVQYINSDDLMRRKALAKELVENYKEYFKDKPGEWFDLESDAKR
jgi:hypothetical protein